ncbi:kynureninase [Halobacterium litoreum]|uniref:Kynureninase n=1 Tax=Halobacterium litoreum TaxID=2039234 RepID=A0ABD5NAP2_9EURY|nr:kynureninase [Halobacterium litoreum]UHH12056.1 kynureninase [Halobacterium litoreum]
MDDFDASQSAARMRDAEASLTGLRERFTTPDDGVYMDGNSLGLHGEDADRALERAVDQWRELGIEAWTEADPPWFAYGERLGDRLADVVGALPAECVAANSTTVNIHALVGSFLDAADGTDVVVNELDFPTDHYAIRSQLAARGLDPDDHLVVVESDDGRTISTDAIADAVDDDTAIVFMPSVLYRSGQLFDLEAITELAHDHDAFAGFDLAHSVGVVPHDLHFDGVDFAVWCSYKYLNAGPGAIGGLYVHEDNFDVEPSLAGWWGNDDATQFDLDTRFDPAEDASAFQIGTVPVFSAAPLFGTLDVVEAAGIDQLRDHSLSLTRYLISLVDERLPECSVGTPREAERRGGHVAVEHPEAGLVSRALRDRGVVVDYRPPDVVRVAPSPYYVGFEDVWTAVDELRDILDADAHRAYADDDATVT